MTYNTSQFILNGTVDFVVPKDYSRVKNPIFLFKSLKEVKNMAIPQLLAELISAVELNDWKFIKRAYITGGNWHFVILEKLERHKYQYFISQNFDSTKIEDLKFIYKNLKFVKNEILSMVDA